VSDGTWKHVAAKTAVDAAKRADLNEPARTLLAPELTPRQYFDMLAAKPDLVPDALAFLASALPKREAVWWACQCVRAVTPAPPPKEDAALKAAEKWCGQANDANRRAAHAAAEAATFAVPAGTAALAAFLSEGSMAPPHVETPVPPADNLTAKLVAATLAVAAVQTTPEKAAEKRKTFLDLGLAVAAGTNRWADAAPARR
jgi:hypothetical protein